MTRAPILLLLLLLSGCGVPRIPGITPYRMEIQQGNFLSQEAITKLKPGMTREEVKLILGTPLLTDIFHGDRWDYVFSRETPDGRSESRRIAVFFADGKLTRVDGGGAPPPSPAAGR
jgi:outer membrane protein assembly factor BamE